MLYLRVFIYIVPSYDFLLVTFYLSHGNISILHFITVGIISEIYISKMAITAFKLSTMVEENFEIYMPQMTKNGPKLSTMVGENFEIYMS